MKFSMGRLIRRVFLVVLLASMAMSALLGVIVVLSGAESEGAGKALLSALTLAFTSLMAFIAAIPLERRRWWGVAVAGLAAAVQCLVVCLILTWGWEFFVEQIRPDSPWQARETLGKIVFTVCCMAFYFPMASILLMPRLKPAGLVVQFGTVGLGAVTLGIGLLMMWGDVNESGLWRCVGAMVILSLCGMVMTPIVARFLAIKTETELKEVTGTVQLTCPRCRLAQTVPVGEGRCVRCKLRFKIEVEEPRCGKCGYFLRGLTRPVCPECGAALGVDDIALDGSDVRVPGAGSVSGREAGEPGGSAAPGGAVPADAAGTLLAWAKANDATKPPIWPVDKQRDQAGS